MRRFLPLLLFGVLCALLLGQLGQGPQITKGSSWPVGHQLPAVLLPLWEPKVTTGINAATPTVPLALPKGQAYVVNVFASWCAPCKAELPQLEALRVEHGIPVIGVAWKDNPKDIAPFLANRKPYNQILLDPQGKALTELGATGVPETYVVGADGIVKERFRSNLQSHQIKAIYEKLNADISKAGR